jgi:hypothetical protein
MMSKSMMQAVRVHEYGSPDVLLVEEIVRPEPQEEKCWFEHNLQGFFHMIGK